MIYLQPKDRLKKEDKVISDTYTVKELKAMCREKGLTGYSKLKEKDLIVLLGL